MHNLSYLKRPSMDLFLREIKGKVQTEKLKKQTKFEESLTNNKKVMNISL